MYKLVYFFVLVIIAGVVLAMLWQVKVSATKKSQAFICESNLKALSSAMFQYAADHDQMLPSKTNWSATIFPYLKTEKTPSIWHCNGSDVSYSYAINSDSSNLKLEKVFSPENTVLLFESDINTINASGDKRSMPHKPRHDGTDIYGFFDGHVHRMPRVRRDLYVHWKLH